MPYETIVIEKVFIPAELLKPCGEVRLDTLEATRDLERIAGAALASLNACNKDKTAIREWQATQ